ncbi:hypothetical protein DFJ77DRAFT_168652 [Powellomyces hirtus]|nr:hypothetical protein DFJ77DRAFT_168652 [Powellomyces hirtus]
MVDMSLVSRCTGLLAFARSLRAEIRPLLNTSISIDHAVDCCKREAFSNKICIGLSTALKWPLAWTTGSSRRLPQLAVCNKLYCHTLHRGEELGSLLKPAAIAATDPTAGRTRRTCRAPSCSLSPSQSLWTRTD